MIDRRHNRASGGRSRSRQGRNQRVVSTPASGHRSQRIATTAAASTGSIVTLDASTPADDARAPSGTSSQGEGGTGSDAWSSPSACTPGSMQGVRHAPRPDFMQANSIRDIPDPSVHRTPMNANTVCPKPKATRQTVAIRRWTNDRFMRVGGTIYATHARMFKRRYRSSSREPRIYPNGARARLVSLAISPTTRSDPGPASWSAGTRQSGAPHADAPPRPHGEQPPKRRRGNAHPHRR